VRAVAEPLGTRDLYELLAVVSRKVAAKTRERRQPLVPNPLCARLGITVGGQELRSTQDRTPGFMLRGRRVDGSKQGLRVGCGG
jgi:hypothetical protein